MYSVSRKKHEVYGDVVMISIEENATYKNPFKAIEQLKLIRHTWLKEGVTKVRLLINNQILTLREAEKWSMEEYRFLPKCHLCTQILDGNVITHRLSGSNLFCSQKCADVDYMLELDKIADEEEIDYL